MEIFSATRTLHLDTGAEAAPEVLSWITERLEGVVVVVIAVADELGATVVATAALVLGVDESAGAVVASSFG